MSFAIKMEEADKREAQFTQQTIKQAGYVINVPQHNDGLDDDELNL